MALVLCCFSDDIMVLGLGLGHMLLQWWPCTLIANQSLSSYSTFWYWVLAFVVWCFSDDHMYHHMKSIPIIHSRLDILVLGLGQGHMLLHWWPCTIISNLSLSSILNSTYWYWVLAKVICCFSDDHVPSYQTYPYHPYSITHIGIGSWLGPYVVSWCPTMYHHIKAYLHHPYSIMHIGIGSWLGPYVVSWWPTMYHHIRAYLHHPYSITHIGIGSRLGPCILSWWLTM